MRSLESQDENQTSSRQLVLTIAYWMLVILGLIARAHYRMNNAVIETYVKDHYTDYKDDMKKSNGRKLDYNF